MFSRILSLFSSPLSAQEPALNLKILILGANETYPFRVFHFLTTSEWMLIDTRTLAQVAEAEIDYPPHKFQFLKIVLPEKELCEGYIRDRKIILLCAVDEKDLEILTSKVNKLDDEYKIIIATHTLQSHIKEHYSNYVCLDLNKTHRECLDVIVSVARELKSTAPLTSLNTMSLL